MSLSIYRIFSNAPKYMLTYQVKLNFGLSLHLYPLFCGASNESSGKSKSAHLNLRCLPMAHLRFIGLERNKISGYRLPPMTAQFWGTSNDCPTKHAIMFVGLRPYFHEY